jgi:hypothetical protein
MHSTITFTSLSLAAFALAKTDMSGCTTTDLTSPAGASVAWYAVPKPSPHDSILTIRPGTSQAPANSVNLSTAAADAHRRRPPSLAAHNTLAQKLTRLPTLLAFKLKRPACPPHQRPPKRLLRAAPAALNGPQLRPIRACRAGTFTPPARTLAPVFSAPLLQVQMSRSRQACQPLARLLLLPRATI